MSWFKSRDARRYEHHGDDQEKELPVLVILALSVVCLAAAWVLLR